MRTAVNNEKVQQYADEMRDGHQFPLPVIFVDQRTRIMMTGDGFHRIMARHLNHETTVECDVRDGRLTEAILHNIEANKQQRGMPFGYGDKRRCIEVLAKRPETAGWTKTKVASTVGCSVDWVLKVVNKGGLDSFPSKTKKPAKKTVKLHEPKTACPHCNGTGFIKAKVA